MKKTVFSSLAVAVLLITTAAPALAAAKIWTLNIHNNTEGDVKITLTGPDNYSFTMAKGKLFKPVEEGTYKYTYTACGEKFSGEIEVDSDLVWLVIEPCDALPIYIKFVIDSHLDAGIAVAMVGPQTYTLTTALGHNKFLAIQAGFYIYTYDACGTTITGEVRVPKNGTGRLILYACEQMANHPPSLPTSAQIATNLRIGSHYGFPIRITLNGPGVGYSFELQTGLNRFNVVRGDYEYFYTAYGVFHSGTFTVGEGSTVFTISPIK